MFPSGKEVRTLRHTALEVVEAVLSCQPRATGGEDQDVAQGIWSMMTLYSYIQTASLESVGCDQSSVST